jgi:tRNA(Ile)-lysidine synthase
MAAAMREDHAEWLLTAHHLEDQAETVLMRLAHGSGIEGLKGMLAYSMMDGLSIARPLLGTPKEELLAVVESAGLTPALDPSNANDHYERVRWRQVMPELEALGLDAERLALFARRMADADEAIAAMAATLVTKWLGERPPSDSIVVSRGKLLGTSTAVAVKALGRMIGMVGEGRKAHDLGRVERLLERLAASDVMKPVTLHGCIIASDGETVSIQPEGARRSPALLTAN